MWPRCPRRLEAAPPISFVMAPPLGAAVSVGTANPLASISLASDLLPHLPGETR